MSRRWSSASSTLPVTRAVASSVRSATSERMRSSERFVSASIWRFVSSSRRVRSDSASSFTRAICASPTLRASARMSAASPFASAMSWRCCSRSSRASSRALSASSTAARMRSRRASIVFWIGPNANLRRTKNVIAKQIRVQIIRPGTTSIRPDATSDGISDEDVGEEPADEAVEHHGLGQREAEPLDALELAAELWLPRDGLDHRSEDVADADAGAERAEADTEGEGDRLARVGAVRGVGEEYEGGEHSKLL